MNANLPNQGMEPERGSPRRHPQIIPDVGVTAMHIELTGVESKAMRGMTTRVVYRLNSTPDRPWLEAFRHVPNVQVTTYPRAMFQFEDDTIACEFIGPRDSEVFETLQLYIADANKQVERAAAVRKAATNPRLARRELKAKRQQTLMLNRELFDEAPDAEE